MGLATHRTSLHCKIGSCLLVLCFLIIACGGYSQKAAKSVQPDVDAQIRYYSDRIAEHPQAYPVYVQLAAAYLDKARQTHDPAYLAKARTALDRSIKIMPNFPAYQTMAAVCNFSHHFQEGLQWAKRAAETVPADTSVTTMLVEAYMGLGQYEEARKLLPPPGQKPSDYYTASALGLWLVSQRRYDEAVDAFLQAADFAQAQNLTSLVEWAKVSAAGALLDSKRPAPARVYLDAAAKLDPKDILLRLHQAELLEVEGHLNKALAAYEALLKEQQDPEIHRRAFLVARKLRQESKARLHFEAAEKGFQRAIDAGEIYTLGALARLYCDAEVNLEQALALAQRNLEYKRDIEAQATLACVRSKLEKLKAGVWQRLFILPALKAS